MLLPRHSQPAMARSGKRLYTRDELQDLFDCEDERVMRIGAGCAGVASTCSEQKTQPFGLSSWNPGAVGAKRQWPPRAPPDREPGDSGLGR
jgi:hypothetical protein